MRGVSLEERFWAKVEKTETCWLWTASKPNGYGQIKIAGLPRRAHRVAYELIVGPIPEGLVLDHLCRVPECVNPAHLEPVTDRDNTLRGVAPVRVRAHWQSITHCPAGHPYDAENTYVRVSRPGRNCKTCVRDAGRRHRARQMALREVGS